MDAIRRETLQAMMGDTPEAQAFLNAVFAAQEVAEKQAQDIGLAFKAALPPALAATNKKPEDAAQDAAPATVVPPVKKADVLGDAVPPIPEGDMGGGMMDDENEGGEFEDSEADNEIDAIIQALHDDLDNKIKAAFQTALAPIQDSVNQIAGALTATKEVGSATLSVLKEIQTENATLKQTVADLTARLTATETATKELQGDVPRGITRASQSADNVLPNDVATAIINANSPARGGATGDPISDFLANMFAGASNLPQGVQ